jgi:hypothetical protein
MKPHPSPMEMQPDHGHVEAGIPMTPSPSNSTGQTAAPAISKSQAHSWRKRSLKKQRLAKKAASAIANRQID